MVCNTKPDEWLKAMADLETEEARTPAQTFKGEPLINLSGMALVTRETAEALASEAA